MIPHIWADVLRWVDVGLCLGLLGACGFAAVLADHWDQRVRFVLFGAFGALLTAGHLATLGRDGSWRLAGLVPVVAVALVSTLAYVRRELQERRVR